MRIRCRIIILIAAIMLCVSASQARAAQEVEVAFSPSTDAIKLLQYTINNAQQSIDVAAYSFTSYKVVDALIDAQRRGVKVQVVLDKGQQNRRYHAISELQTAGIPVRFNGNYAIMHNKFMIIDDKTIESGSFNYTTSAEKRNAENVIVIRDNKPLAAKFVKNWKKLWDEAG